MVHKKRTVTLKIEVPVWTVKEALKHANRLVEESTLLRPSAQGADCVLKGITIS